MYRTLLVAVALASWPTGAGGPTPAEDSQRLNGVWVSPRLLLDEDLEGWAELALEFNDPDQPLGQARLNFVPGSQLAPPLTVGLLRAEVRKPGRQIVLVGQDPGSRMPDASITLAYELTGDRLTLTSPERFRHPTLPAPVELSGEWRREKSR